MAVRMRNIESGDTERCIIIAERAFREDPFFRAVSGCNGAGYPLLLSLLVRVWLESQTPFGVEKDGDLVGFAIVSSTGGGAVSARRCVKLGAGRVVRACGVGNLLAFLRAAACFDRVWDSQPGPKRYLTLLAVDPDHQGKGAGTALLQEGVLPCLREEGAAALCLNTNNEKNRTFYYKNHFEEVGTASLRVGKLLVSDWSFRLEFSGERGQ